MVNSVKNKLFLLPLLALHNTAVAICKGEKLGYECLFHVVGTIISLNTKAVLTLKKHIYMHVYV